MLGITIILFIYEFHVIILKKSINKCRYLLDCITNNLFDTKMLILITLNIKWKNINFKQFSFQSILNGNILFKKFKLGTLLP